MFLIPRNASTNCLIAVVTTYLIMGGITFPLKADDAQQQQKSLDTSNGGNPDGDTPANALPLSEFQTRLTYLIARLPELAGVKIRKVEFTRDGDTVYLDPVGELKLESQRDAFSIVANHVADSLKAKTGIDLRARQVRMDVARPQIDQLKSQLKSWIEREPGMAGAQILGIRYSMEDQQVVAKFDAVLAFEFQRTAVTDKLNEIFSTVFGEGLILPARPNAKTGIVTYKKPSPVEFVNEIQSLIEENTAMDGVLICDAEYVKQVGDDQFQLSGRVASEEQLEILVGMANKLIVKKYGPQWPRAVSSGLEIVLPARVYGRKYFLLGTSLYQRKCYEDAHRAFQYAVVESPSSLVYRYWLIVTKIQLGQSDSAYKVVKRVVMARKGIIGPMEYDYCLVLLSFERVQGPVRRTLHHFEQQALLECEIALRPSSTR